MSRERELNARAWAWTSSPCCRRDVWLDDGPDRADTVHPVKQGRFACLVQASSVWLRLPGIMATSTTPTRSPGRRHATNTRLVLLAAANARVDMRGALGRRCNALLRFADPSASHVAGAACRRSLPRSPAVGFCTVILAGIRVSTRQNPDISSSPCASIIRLCHYPHTRGVPSLR